MSVQAMSWAISQQIVTDPSARHVLLCMANYADTEGDSVYPSLARLSRDTGLSLSTIRRCLKTLLSAGVIAHSNAKMVEVSIERSDRRPICYKINLLRGVMVTPRSGDGVSGWNERGVMVTQTGCHGDTRSIIDPSMILTPKTIKNKRERKVFDGWPIGFDPTHDCKLGEDEKTCKARAWRKHNEKIFNQNDK